MASSARSSGLEQIPTTSSAVAEQAPPTVVEWPTLVDIVDKQVNEARKQPFEQNNAALD